MKKRRKKNYKEWLGKILGNLNKEVYVLQVNIYGLEFFKLIYFKLGLVFILI